MPVSKRTAYSPYLVGLTRSEAYNMIAHLPNPTEQERNELVAAANQCPNQRGRAEGRLSEDANQRIQELVTYLQENPNATHAEITAYMKLNGNNLYYILNKALDLHAVTRRRDGKRYFYAAR